MKLSVGSHCVLHNTQIVDSDFDSYSRVRGEEKIRITDNEIRAPKCQQTPKLMKTCMIPMKRLCFHELLSET